MAGCTTLCIKFKCLKSAPFSKISEICVQTYSVDSDRGYNPLKNCKFFKGSRL